MLLNLGVVDRSESKGLDFVMFVVDDSNDDRHKLSDLMRRNMVTSEKRSLVSPLSTP